MLIRANCDFFSGVSEFKKYLLYCSRLLLRAAIYLLHFFILRVCVCECVLVWVVVFVVCLVSLLIYYGRIWVALSYCFFSLLPVLFCFESCCVSVVLWDGCEGSSLLLCMCILHVQLKPTLNKRKKVRNEPRCFSFVWLCVYGWVCEWFLRFPNFVSVVVK